MVKKNIKNWDNKTWLSSNSYIKSFNKFLIKETKLNKNSKILDIFNPIINIKNSEIEVEIISESSELNYGTEELFIPSKIIFKGMYLNQPFTGEADEMNFYFLENRISFSKNLMLIFDEKEYKGQNIEINTKDKSIMGSDKISINKINDFKNKKDL